MEPVRSNALSTHRQVDVLMLSDFRFPGVTSHSIAEEIAAQAQAGWSTGLVHTNGPLVSRVTPVNPEALPAIPSGSTQHSSGADQNPASRPRSGRLPGNRH